MPPAPPVEELLLVDPPEDDVDPLELVDPLEELVLVPLDPLDELAPLDPLEELVLDDDDVEEVDELAPESGVPAAIFAELLVGAGWVAA